MWSSEGEEEEEEAWRLSLRRCEVASELEGESAIYPESGDSRLWREREGGGGGEMQCTIVPYTLPPSRLLSHASLPPSKSLQFKGGVLRDFPHGNTKHPIYTCIYKHWDFPKQH